GPLVGHPPVKDKEHCITPVHVLTDQFEEIIPLGHALYNFRQLRHTAPVPLGQKGLVAAGAEHGVNALIKISLPLVEQRGRNVYLHGTYLLLFLPGQKYLQSNYTIKSRAFKTDLACSGLLIMGREYFKRDC